MADLYVRSTDGADGDNGSTWALAKATLQGAYGAEAAGDRIFVSQAHDQSTGTSITITSAGTAAGPVSVICGNDAAEPPTAVAESAIVGTASSSAGRDIAFSTSSAHDSVYGIIFRTQRGGGTGTGDINLGSSSGWNRLFEKCSFETEGSNTAIRCFNSTSAGLAVLRDCTVKFANASQRCQCGSGAIIWEGGGLAAGGTAPDNFCSSPGSIGARFSGLDLSAGGSSMNIFFSAATLGVLRNCKLPSSWSGGLISGSGTYTASGRVEMYNCDAGDVNYAIRIGDNYGDLLHETTLVRSGGASDGDTPISWRIVTTANPEFNGYGFETPEIVRRQNTVGSPITVTLHILHDSATNLQDDEIYLEVLYLGTSGFPLGTYITDAAATRLTAGADQASSSETWTTTGMSNPNKQKLSVTFTPQEKGYIVAMVHVVKPSYTVYVDPKLEIS